MEKCQVVFWRCWDQLWFWRGWQIARRVTTKPSLFVIKGGGPPSPEQCIFPKEWQSVESTAVQILWSSFRFLSSHFFLFFFFPLVSVFHSCPNPCCKCSLFDLLWLLKSVSASWHPAFWGVQCGQPISTMPCSLRPQPSFPLIQRAALKIWQKQSTCLALCSSGSNFVSFWSPLSAYLGSRCRTTKVFVLTVLDFCLFWVLFLQLLQIGLV